MRACSGSHHRLIIVATRLALEDGADESLIAWFLANGADPNARYEMDMTPLSIAVQFAPLPIIETLFAHSKPPFHGQLLHHAARRTSSSDCKAVIELVLQRCGRSQINDIMYQNHAFSFEIRKCVGFGTALYEAARYGTPQAVRVLLDHGADASVRGTCGRTALEVAEKAGNRVVVDLLSVGLRGAG